MKSFSFLFYIFIRKLIKSLADRKTAYFQVAYRKLKVNKNNLRETHSPLSFSSKPTRHLHQAA